MHGGQEGEGGGLNEVSPIVSGFQMFGAQLVVLLGQFRGCSLAKGSMSVEAGFEV